MKKIILKELLFQDTKIKFKKGINYIIGSNNSGKTTIYNLIQFVLGLKKEVKKPFNINDFTSPIILICIIGDREVLFQRNINSEYIFIQYDDTNEPVRYMSSNLKEVYDYLFEPFFVFENEKGSAYDIIKSSFLSEFRINLTRGRIDSLKRMLGVNVSYINQASIDYQKLKKNLENESKSIEQLEEFIRKIQHANNVQQKVDGDKLNELLYNEYGVIIGKHKEIFEFLETAEKVLIEKQDFLDKYLDERISIFESFYFSLLNQVDIRSNSHSFRDFFKIRPFRNKYSSGSQIYVEFLCFMLTLTRSINDERHNGCGLLLNDLSLTDIDNINKYNLQNWMKNETELGALQYIEFTTNYRKELSKEMIAFDLDSLERFI